MLTQEHERFRGVLVLTPEAGDPQLTCAYCGDRTRYVPTERQIEVMHIEALIENAQRSDAEEHITAMRESVARLRREPWFVEGEQAPYFTDTFRRRVARPAPYRMFRTGMGLPSCTTLCEPCFGEGEECSGCHNHFGAGSITTLHERLADGSFTEREDDPHYCVGCLGVHAVTCHSCGNMQTRAWTVQETCDRRGRPTYASRDYCRSCHAMMFPPCEGCGTHHPLSTLLRATRGALPDDDVRCTCGRGDGALRHMEECRRGRNGTVSIMLCPVCASDRVRYPSCPECGRLHPAAGPNPCEEVRTLGSPAINSYDYRPVTKFFMTEAEGRDPATRPDLFVGFELEVEVMGSRTPQDCAMATRAPYLYFKTDGSLNHGFEIVSHPLSWAWLRAHSDDFAERWRKLVSMGARSFNTNTCGLHVHLSKRAFTSLHLFKFMALIYDNKSQVIRLSQRRPEQLRQYASFDAERAQDRPRKARGRDNNIGASRYVAVNLNNRATVEVRFLRGTLLPTSFFKGLEFVVAAYEYTRQVGITEASSWEKFTAWARRNVRDFPNLVAYLGVMDDANALATDTEAPETQVKPYLHRPVETRQQRAQRILSARALDAAAVLAAIPDPGTAVHALPPDHDDDDDVDEDGEVREVDYDDDDEYGGDERY